MDYLAVALAWPRFIDAPLRDAKREALREYVAPTFDTLQAAGHVDNWSHTFWGTDDLGTNVVRIIARADEPETAAAHVREAFDEFGLDEDASFRVEAPFDPERLRGFWGESVDAWLDVRAGLSSLAVDAIEGRLGESYAWHREQNRPGHVWANQLGLTYMDEAAVYQQLALGYFGQVPMANATDEQRAAFDAVREHMDAAADGLPDV